MLTEYFRRIYELAKTGEATEESYYSSVEQLFRAFARSTNRRDIFITVAPKKTQAGYPDFKMRQESHTIGYVEAKDLLENLDNIEHSEQIKRYKANFPNFILTNFVEFRLYRNGILVDQVLLVSPAAIRDLKHIPSVEHKDKFINLLEKFVSFLPPEKYTAKELAAKLATRTRFLKERVLEELKGTDSVARRSIPEDSIRNFYDGFRELLISKLTKEDFADLYAQTITFGFFAARTNYKLRGGFSRIVAYHYVPKTIGILRQVFRFISLGELSEQMKCVADDICEVLAAADVNKLLSDYYRNGKGEDPVYYFYETFLSQYNPKEREGRGVYYTPAPVVSYIARSLNIILKEHFQKETGFASNGVTVLDPAAGTLTFLAEASKLAVKEFTNKYGEGAREAFIKDHILQNFYAFELMMSPYVIGHLKMQLLLANLGYELKQTDRVKLYLTNTLEMEERKPTWFPGISSLAGEAAAAMPIKKKIPILVILGNPPYSGHSFNIGEWISKEIRAYYEVDGKPLHEKNPKWLQDDYVKFTRFAQWKIDQNGEGILGFITNHSYLNNPTFRGMRQSLMNSFNEIYLLDLHGNTLKKERCPDGSKDDNVFDIQQGVAISLFIKKRGLEKKVLHSERWGLQKDKYNWLSGNDIKTTDWKQIKPKSDFYLFVPTEEALLEVYNKYPRVTGIFPLSSVGIVTSRDDFVIDFDRQALEGRIKVFRDKELSDETITQAFGLKDKANWKLTKTREKVNKDDKWGEAVTRILYRPFDVRWIFYYDELIERSRKEVMHHMMKENLGLLTCRQNTLGFHHAFICKDIVESCIVSNKTREIGYLFPLYLYPSKGDMFSQEAKEKKPNLNPKLVKSLTEAYGKEPTPEEIFYYTYGVLYSNIYRNKYADFLKIDFPRVPFSRDYELFSRMGKHGSELVDLHLLKSAELGNPIAKLQGNGDYHVEKPKYNEKENHVYINLDQYFDGIEKQVWEYQIGGYQVLDKWLKYRKGQQLSLDDIKHYCQVVTILKRTMEVQKEIDNLYPDIEKETVSIQEVW